MDRSEHDQHIPDGQHQSHDKHAGHSVKMFRDKFWLSLILTVPVLAYSDMFQHWLRITPPEFFGSQYVPFVFSTIIFVYGGLVFIRGARAELAEKNPGMMTLISMAIVAAYSYSVATQFFIEGGGFFWELATLTTIMLLGHWLEMAAITKAEDALGAIAALLPDTAEKIVDDKPRQVLVANLEVDDLVLLRPGSIVPVDGTIIDGSSSINEAAITGESKPISKSIGDGVVAGTLNQDGSLTIRTTKVGEDTALAGIMRLVAEAQASKSNVQVLADKAAFVLTLVAIGAGVLTFAYWLIAKDAAFALERSVTVLIIACPHALGLAIPLVVAISTALSARNGLLVRRRLALEVARRLDWVLFDKTGTLTRGEHGVTDVWATKGYTKKDVLALAASVEQHSEHIIGRGIVKYATKQHIALYKVTETTVMAGLGVQGVLRDKGTFIAVSRRYLTERGISVPAKLAAAISQAAKDGKTEVYLVTHGKVIGGLALADMIREQSIATIKSLQQMGIKTAMVTGDSREVASFVARQLGLDQYLAEVNPEGKTAMIKELQKNGQRVAMIGDGINDAPALLQADIGVAIGAGTDVAIKSADIILVKDNPKDVVKIINISKRTYQKMLQNLLWATGYNIVAIPLAAGALSSVGVVLAPALGAILMSVSTIVVALNAQLLRGAKI